jgi:hypothetical protein
MNIENHINPYTKELANSIYQSLFLSEQEALSSEPGTLQKIILEIMLEGGLDTMAIYLDGSIKYINHSGRISLLGSPNKLSSKCTRILKIPSAHDYKKITKIESLPKSGLSRITIFTENEAKTIVGDIVSLSKNQNTKELLFLCAILLHDIVALIEKSEPTTCINKRV